MRTEKSTKARIEKESSKVFGNIACSLLVAISLLNSASYVYAEMKIGSYSIRQEIVREKGVLVSRPNKNDETAYNLLERNTLKTPEEYAKWLEVNIKYRKDEDQDSWQKPQELLRKKIGDCEDFTFLTSAVLKVMGFTPRFLAFFTSKEGHAVCVFKKGKKYYYFDNAELKEVPEVSLDKFAKRIMKEEGYATIKELDVETKKWNLLYKNT